MAANKRNAEGGRPGRQEAGFRLLQKMERVALSRHGLEARMA